MTDRIELPRELLYRICNAGEAGLSMAAEVAELRALLAQPASVPDEVRRDAERYRWLCGGNGYFLEQLSLCGHSDQKAEADAAIDAAMSHTPDA